MVIAEEFGDWLDSSRRIDLLCLDSVANLVVVELKRTDDGGRLDLVRCGIDAAHPVVPGVGGQ